MAEPHVVSALKAKRAEIAGELAGLAKEIALRQADLQHVDATLRRLPRSRGFRLRCSLTDFPMCQTSATSRASVPETLGRSKCSLAARPVKGLA